MSFLTYSAASLTLVREERYIKIIIIIIIIIIVIIIITESWNRQVRDLSTWLSFLDTLYYH